LCEYWYVGTRIFTGHNMENTIAESDISGLNLLLEKVYRDGGYDFREYKQSTITRRLARRLEANGLAGYREYMQFLDISPEEYQKLAEYITIKSSGFFRTPFAFEQVANLVLPRIFSRREMQGQREVKFWSAACACGQEPYSTAIMLVEYLGQRRDDFNINIDATDISQWALTEAEKGIYTADDLGNVPAGILKKYFTRHGQSFRISDNIKQMVSFSRFDLTSNVQAAFTELDCIFCCNILIYWRKKLQERVLEELYNSLAVPGYLVLGEVETLPQNLRDKMECLDSKAKIYEKRSEY